MFSVDMEEFRLLQSASVDGSNSKASRSTGWIDASLARMPENNSMMSVAYYVSFSFFSSTS
jgi:hypothetical protein